MSRQYLCIREFRVLLLVRHNPAARSLGTIRLLQVRNEVSIHGVGRLWVAQTAWRAPREQEVGDPAMDVVERSIEGMAALVLCAGLWVGHGVLQAGTQREGGAAGTVCMVCAWCVRMVKNGRARALRGFVLRELCELRESWHQKRF